VEAKGKTIYKYLVEKKKRERETKTSFISKNKTAGKNH